LPRRALITEQGQEVRMRASDIMKGAVECLQEQDTVEAAARRMRDHNIGFLPVCDDESHVMGTLTDRDIAIRLVAEGKECSTRVADVMTREAVTCGPDLELGEVEKLLAQYQKSRCMVVDDGGKLVGVISLSDLAQHDEKQVGRTLRDVSSRESHSLH
jgi:CBS domain-containing protein